MTMEDIKHIKDFLDNNYTVSFQDGYISGNVIAIEDETAWIIDWTTEEEVSIDMTKYHYRMFNFYK